MGRIEQAIESLGSSDAFFEFEQLVAEVHKCHCDGREDIDVAIRERLISSGVPAAVLAEGSAEMGLVIQLARALNVATLSFGMIKMAQESESVARQRSARRCSAVAV